MRKFAKFVSVLALILALTACSGKENGQNPQNDGKNPVVSDPTPTAQTQATPQPTPAHTINVVNSDRAVRLRKLDVPNQMQRANLVFVAYDDDYGIFAVNRNSSDAKSETAELIVYNTERQAVIMLLNLNLKDERVTGAIFEDGILHYTTYNHADDKGYAYSTNGMQELRKFQCAVKCEIFEEEDRILLKYVDPHTNEQVVLAFNDKMTELSRKPYSSLNDYIPVTTGDVKCVMDNRFAIVSNIDKNYSVIEDMLTGRTGYLGDYYISTGFNTSDDFTVIESDNHWYTLEQDDGSIIIRPVDFDLVGKMTETAFDGDGFMILSKNDNKKVELFVYDD